MTIPAQYPWNSSQFGYPREPRETAKAGQRRKCHIIELSECPSVTQAGQRRKCNRIELSDYPDIAQAGQRRKCNRIELFECLIVLWLGPHSSNRNRYSGLRLGLEGTAFQAEDSDRTPNPGGGPGRVLNGFTPETREKAARRKYPFPGFWLSSAFWAVGRLSRSLSQSRF